MYYIVRRIPASFCDRLLAIGVMLLTSFALPQSLAAQSLPAGWSALDVNAPTLAGATSFVNGTFTVTGAGADIWGTSDQFRFAYRQVTGDVDVVAKVASADQLLRSVATEIPDVAVVDIRMPPTHTAEGLEAAKTIRSRWPSVGVLVLSQYVETEYALRLLEGSEDRCGYLLKDRVLDGDELAGAVRRVGAGGVVVDPELVNQLVARSRVESPLDELTAREKDVLALMAEGLTDRGIGERLFVTPKTVETHARHIFAKLSLPATPTENKRVHAVLTYLRA